MGTTTVIVLLLLLLTGCSAISAITPTMQNCQKVSYIRDGAHISINAECTAPVNIMVQ